MKIAELIDEYHRHNPKGHQFDRESLQAIGLKRSELKIAKKPVEVKDYIGIKHQCYDVIGIQRIPYNEPKELHIYLDTETFHLIV